MSEISKLNGYDLKDATARQNINTLNLVKIQSYQNIEDMKNDTTLVEGQHVKTKGYYQENDGGSGEYIIIDDSTLTEDGGLFHELTNGLFAKLIVNNGFINVRQYGAKGDSTTNDTNALLNAFNSTLNIYIPEGTFIFNSRITITESPIIKCDGYLEYSGEEIDGAIIIGTSTETNNKDIEIKLTRTDRYENGNYSGVILKNINNSNIKIKNINNFGIGCMFLSDGYGSCYNKIELGYLFNNNIGICLQSNNSGWTNENLFLNGNFKVSNSIDKTGTIGILLDSNNYYKCNNNVFIKPSIEQIDTAIKINYGHSNKFENIRSESNNITAIILNDSKNNTIYVGNGDMNYTSNSITNKIISSIEKNFGNGIKIFETNLVDESYLETSGDNVYINFNKSCVMHSGGSTSTGVGYTGNYVRNENYLIQSVQNKAIGIFIDTSKAKKFLIKKITEPGYAGRFCLRCYDSSKAVISNATSIDSFETINSRTEINNTYMNATNNPRDLYFTIPENVKYIFLGVSKIGNNDIHIKSYEIYSDYECDTSNDLSQL